MIYCEVKCGEFFISLPIDPRTYNSFFCYVLGFHNFWNILGQCMVKDYLEALPIVFECSKRKRCVLSIFLNCRHICSLNWKQLLELNVIVIRYAFENSHCSSICGIRDSSWWDVYSAPFLTLHSCRLLWFFSDIQEFICQASSHILLIFLSALVNT